MPLAMSGSPLLDEIIREIQTKGSIPFDRYMELSLYHPQWGYYEQSPEVIGSQGDYCTSVSLCSLFGQLLAEQLVHWSSPLTWQNPPTNTHNNTHDKKWIWIESGAHAGKLANDILNRIADLHLTDKVEYRIIEPSSTRRAWQHKTLAHHPNIRWYSTLAESASSAPCAIYLSNELLDAFPCRVFEYNATQQTWLELFVTTDPDKNLHWQKKPTSLPLPIQAIVDQNVFTDRYRIEYSATAAQWWQKACSSLQEGILCTIDYGIHNAEIAEGFKPASTIRAIRHQKLIDNWLDTPGQTDLSSSVHWDDLIQIGELSGMKTDFLLRQEQFLIQIVQRLQDENHIALIPVWDKKTSSQKTSSTPEPYPLRVHPGALKTLAHPEYLGAPFQVLILSQTPDQ